MNHKKVERRRFLKASGATAILAGVQPGMLFAADAPMSLATFQGQINSRFDFFDDAGHQAQLWLMAVSDLSVEPIVEQFTLSFTSFYQPALPDGVYHVTTPAGEQLVMDTELVGATTTQQNSYTVICALLQE